MRLWSGLGLGLFMLMHFGNIALGLVSVAAMEAAAPWVMAPWRSAAGTVLLYGALLVHFVLTLRVLYRRRTLLMSTREAVQLGLGLLIPVLLAGHVMATRIVPALSDHRPTYEDVVRALWVSSPAAGWQQVAALGVAWSHLCFGLWYWLRSKRWFPRMSGLLLVAAVLVPMLALLGFAEAGKTVQALPPRPPSPVPPFLGISGNLLLPSLQAALAGAVAAVLLARLVRRWSNRHRAIRITFPKDRVVTVPAGMTILEASRVERIPHASACGGRGRCSTCRVRVLAGLGSQPAPNAQEAATLRRCGAEPDIRLACQLRPTHDLAVLPIFPPDEKTQDLAVAGTPPVAGHERELAILFCDLRGFTRRAEQWLPYDTVYVLNRYFEAVGRAVEEAGGHLDKFIGDGALALFGLDTTPDVACRQALDAAEALGRALVTLNAQMSQQLADPLRIAMGLHTGPAIVGDMGYGRAVSLTAIGDGINVASRLEGAAKDADVEAMVSLDLAIRAGLDLAAFPRHRITVRGRLAPVDALTVVRAAMLARSPLPRGEGRPALDGPALRAQRNAP